MDRLLRKAEEIEGYEVGAFDRNNFADVAEAIHIIQENMGIAGTTSREAAGTISGSLAMTKSAWENLLVGIADPSQDMSALTENLINSAVTAADNLVPRIGEIMGGIGNAVVDLAPQIGEAFSSITPMIGDALSGALSLVGIEISGDDITGALESTFSRISEIGGTLKETLGSVFGGTVEVISENMGGITEAFSGIGDLIGGVFSTIGGLVSQIDFSQLFGGLLDIINSVIDALSGIGSAVGSVISSITSAFSGVDFGAIFDGLVGGITTAVEIVGSSIELIVTAVGAIVEPIASFIASVIEECQTAGTTLNTVWNGISATVGTAVDVIQGVIATIVALFEGDLQGAVDAAVGVGQSIVDGLTGSFNTITEVINSTFGDIGEKIAETWETIKNGAGEVVESIKNFFTGLKLDPPTIDFSGLIEAARNTWASIKSIFTGDNSSNDSGSTTVTAKAKANADGAILKRATLFGKVGNTYQIGGEAGPEAVAPIDTLQGYVKSSVSEAMAGQNVASADAFAASATAIVDELRTMTDEIVSALSNTSITINNRTFGRLVREV